MLAGIEPQTKAAITGSKEEYSCLTVLHDRLVVDGDYGRVKGVHGGIFIGLRFDC